MIVLFLVRQAIRLKWIKAEVACWSQSVLREVTLVLRGFGGGRVTCG